MSKLASILTVISSVFTLFAAAIVLAGWDIAALFLIMSVLAFMAWIWAGDAEENEANGLMALVLAIAPLFLVLSTTRYAGNWVPLLQEHYARWFAPDFAFTGFNWFVLFVCTPVVMITFGAYLLSQRTPIGSFMVWWSALFALVEGGIQLAGGFAGGANTMTLLSALAGLALIGLGLLILQRLLQPKAADIPTPPPLTDRQRLLWAALFIAGVAVYAVTLVNQAGMLPVMIIVGSMIGGMVGWWLTTSRRPADPAWSVPLYLLLLTLFYIHVGEEALTNFNGMISIISGKEWSDHDFTLLIGLVGPVVWFFAAWSLWHRQAIGNFIFWFLIVGMILGEPTHLVVFPVRLMAIQGIGYEYASGMYTALFPMIPAIIALVRIIREHRGDQAT